MFVHTVNNRGTSYVYLPCIGINFNNNNNNISKFP